jgi:hypothetical protein
MDERDDELHRLDVVEPWERLRQLLVLLDPWAVRQRGA